MIFNFDGTSNEPEDAVQRVDRKGAIDDDNITSILKFHFLFGGDLKKESTVKDGQISFYYSGVGTYGNFFQRLFNSGLSRESEDVTIVIIGVDHEKMGLVVDGLLGQEDVVIKSIAENYQNVRGIAGASIRGDGTVSLILDVVAMLDMSSKREMPGPKVAQPVE